MSRFQTLLLREWLQHRRGWLSLMFGPALVLLIVSIGFLFNDSARFVAFNTRPATPMSAWLAVTLIGLWVLPAMTWGAVFFQAPGFARRDRQDRSIEFWLSLPVGHASSVGAPLLVHALLIPLLAMVIGYACSQVIGLLVVGHIGGFSALAGVNWGEVLTTGLAMLARGLVGVALASLWLLPIVLLGMVASAWLKRWGVPVLVGGLFIANLVLSQVYGIRWIGEAFTSLGQGAAHSMVDGRPPLWGFGPGSEDWNGSWPITPSWLAEDALHAVMNLWQPLFGFALLFSAVCFGLLVLHRRQPV